MVKAVGISLILTGAGLATLAVEARTHHVVCAVAPSSCGATALLWSLSCDVLLASAAGLLALTTIAALRSIQRQRTRTAAALRPLLALPAVDAPADLAVQLRTLGLEGRTTLIACAAPVALCHGLLWPRLLLSTGAFRSLTPAEAEAVLRHEQAHLRRRDPLRLVLARALAEAVPAATVLGRIATALPITQELAADRAALAAVGSDAVAGAMLKVGDALGAVQGDALAIGAFSPLDARIDQLLGAPPPPLAPSPRAIARAALLLPVALLAALVPLLWCMAAAPILLGLVGRRWPRRGGARMSTAR